MQGKTLYGFMVFCTLAIAGAEGLQASDSHTLVVRQQQGGTTRVETLLEVTGQIKVRDGEQVKALPMQVVGKSSYLETLVKPAAKVDAPRRAVRKYDQVAAKFKVGEQTTDPTVREAQRLLVADWSTPALTLFSANGHLTQEELDLVHGPGDSLLVDALLPIQPVAIGDRWQLAPDILAAFIGIDAVSSNDIECELKEANVGTAKCELAGKLFGAIDGVATEIELKAKYTFDIQQGRVTWLALLIKENRSISHAAPGVEATARLQMKIVPLPAGEYAIATKGLSLEPTPVAQRLAYISDKGQCEVDYDRRWHLMSDDDKGAVFRMVDRGELVAQCNLTPLVQQKTGEPTPLAKFQADIQQALGESFGEFVTAAQNVDDPNRMVYRVVAIGKASDLPVQWNYHLITDRGGRQVLVVFTLESNLVGQFGDADKDFVDAIRFTTPPTSTARRAATKTRLQ